MNPLRSVLSTIRKALDRAIAWKATPYIVLVVICGVMVFPIYWTLATSFKPMTEIYQWPPTLVPHQLTTSNYVYALLETPFSQNILSSVIYALSATLFIVVIGSLTTYGFVVYPYRGSHTSMLIFLATRIIPPQTLWLPFIIVLSRLGLINTRPAVIVFLIVLIYPLSIWMLRGIFEAFPKDLIDAAAVDGASRIQTLVKVVVPVVAPGVGAVAIVAFLWSWNEFMFPFLALNSPHLYPITVGLFHFISDEGVLWGPISASGLIAILPGVLFFIFAQRYIVEGLTRGALK